MDTAAIIIGITFLSIAAIVSRYFVVRARRVAETGLCLLPVGHTLRDPLDDRTDLNGWRSGLSDPPRPENLEYANE